MAGQMPALKGTARYGTSACYCTVVAPVDTSPQAKFILYTKKHSPSIVKETTVKYRYVPHSGGYKAENGLGTREAPIHSSANQLNQYDRTSNVSDSTLLSG